MVGRQHRSCPWAEKFREWFPSLKLDDPIDEYFNSRAIGSFARPIQTRCGFPAIAWGVKLTSVEGTDSRSLHDLGWENDLLTLPPAGVRCRRLVRRWKKKQGPFPGR